ncbi:hypothetical protein BUE93_20860 [Chromobacterium amazonense]|uniref:DUF1376 domain-containing protein n=1 Tax=Chromobacterium amazonense TaxID=1382803 RepID=A0A2S9WZ32_9NEIS|nr:YdaU family protein [Chromobacterium amazonense]PRP68719.1 hypothetical protein BUE93_20860 [Chromobacterium amazonense]
MNFYKRFMGDYARATAHLSLAEHGAYTLLLDHYYATEKGLPADPVALFRICRAFTQEEQAAVQAVIDQFFPVAGDGMRHNSRADEQITEDMARIAIARENGKRGGRRKQTQPEPNGNPAGLQNKPNGFANGNQEENQTETQRASSPQPEPEHTTEPIGSFVCETRTPANDRAGIPVPADLEIDRTALLTATQLHLDADVELQRFIAHHQAQSTTRRDAAAWQAQFRKWLLDQHQFNADRERVTQSRMANSTTIHDQRTAAANTIGVGEQYLTGGHGYDAIPA